jgi:hypothetical protein
VEPIFASQLVASCTTTTTFTTRNMHLSRFLVEQLLGINAASYAALDKSERDALQASLQNATYVMQVNAVVPSSSAQPTRFYVQEMAQLQSTAK